MDLGGVKEKEGKVEGEAGEEEGEEEEISAATLRGKPRPLPISALPAFSYIPPRRQGPKEHSYFSREGQTGIVSLYDCVFKRRLDYNQKLHRDDREHAKNLGLHISEEEQERTVPVLMSSVYGKRIDRPIEPLNRDYGHVKCPNFNKFSCESGDYQSTATNGSTVLSTEAIRTLIILHTEV